MADYRCENEKCNCYPFLLHIYCYVHQKKTPVRGHFAEVGTFARQMDRSDFNSQISPSTFPPSNRKSFQLVLKIVLDPFQTINKGATAASCP